MSKLFSTQEKTRIAKTHYGWEGLTYVTVNGYDWHISTMKRHNGTVSTHCHIVEGNEMGFSWSPFEKKAANEDFHLNTLEKGTKATEKIIREAHFKALAEFDAMNEASQLPVKSSEYQIEVGQIVFTDMVRLENQKDDRRAIYKIEKTKYGTTYHTVYLNGKGFGKDDHIRPITKKFGIGVYYNEGEKITQDEISDLLIAATEWKQQEQARIEAQTLINEQQAQAKKDYLAQFKQADRRQTTNLIKKHIAKTWPQVQEVKVKSEVYSGGSSLNVWYTAPAEIIELKAFIKGFQYGKFNGMEDIYEYSAEYVAPIIDGFICEDFTYTFTNYKECEAIQDAAVETVEIEAPKTEKNADIQLLNYSDRAFAVFGNTKPIKDQLKQMGGKFNAYLTHPETKEKTAGWIFSIKNIDTVKGFLF